MSLGQHDGDGIRYAMHLSAPKGGTAQMLRDPAGGWVSYEDYARLKADVNELADGLKLASEVGIKMADEVTRLKSEVERLTKAGDAMASILQFEEQLYHEHAQDPKPVQDWLAAKEGKQS